MSKSAKKRSLILEEARKIFIRKGYNGVTMKDIIEGCGISRGGIYLYFSSVDQIYMAVISEHNTAKLESAKTRIHGDEDFGQLLDMYFDTQKNRLLHIENSLTLSMYEFFLAHKNKYDKNFFYEQFISNKNILLEILQKGKVDKEKAEEFAGMAVYLLEGMATLAMTCGLEEKMMDAQFSHMKKLFVSGGRA